MFANKPPEVTGFHGYCTFFKNGTCQIHANCISSLEITHVSSFIGSLFTQMFSRCHKDCLISFSDGSVSSAQSPYQEITLVACHFHIPSPSQSCLQIPLFSLRTKPQYMQCSLSSYRNVPNPVHLCLFSPR